MGKVQEEFSYYIILGCHAESTDEEIRNAYYALARKLHPDKGGDAGAFAALHNAYRATRTPAARRALGATLALGSGPCPACDATGARRRQRGPLAVELSPCPACGGCGYMRP